MARARRKRGNKIPGGNLFPFVSIMFCTIGGLILLWAAGSLDAVVEDPELPNEIARTKAVLNNLRDEMSDELALKRSINEQREVAQARLEDLQVREDEILQDIRSERQRLDALREQLDRRLEETRDLAVLQQEVVAKELIVEEFAQRRNVLQEIQALQDQLREGLTDLLAAREVHLDLQDAVDGVNQKWTQERELLRDLSTKENPEAQLIIDGDAAFSPIVIEVQEQGFTIMDMQGESQSALLGMEYLTNEHLEGYKTFVGQGTHFPILLVRPQGHTGYANLSQWLRRERMPYSSVPIENDWDFRIQLLAGEE